MDVLVPAPKVRAGLLPNSPVPVPKDGALVVVVPKPAVLFPNKFCNNRRCTGVERSKIITLQHKIKKMPEIHGMNISLTMCCTGVPMVPNAVLL